MKVLVDNYNNICYIDNIISMVWNGADGTNESLNRCVCTLRNKLGADANWIITHHGLGYRLRVTDGDDHDRLTLKSKPVDAAPVLKTARELLGFRSAANLEAAERIVRNWLDFNEPDPSAWVFLAEIAALKAIRGFVEPLSAAGAGIYAAHMARRLKADFPMAMALEGWFQAVILGTPGGIELIEKAQQAAPDDAGIALYRAWAYLNDGRIKAAIETMDLVEDTGITGAIPSAAVFKTALLFLDGQIYEARASSSRNVKAFPWDSGGFYVGSIIESYIGDHEEALRLARIALEINPDMEFLKHNIAYISACAGDLEAPEYIELAATSYSQRVPVCSQMVPAALALHGPVAARAVLERAITSGCPNRGLIKHDPRFQQIYRKIEGRMEPLGSPEDNLA